VDDALWLALTVLWIASCMTHGFVDDCNAHQERMECLRWHAPQECRR
jgi:hypothetical protein